MFLSLHCRAREGCRRWVWLGRRGRVWRGRERGIGRRRLGRWGGGEGGGSFFFLVVGGGWGGRVGGGGGSRSRGGVARCVVSRVDGMVVVGGVWNLGSLPRSLSWGFISPQSPNLYSVCNLILGSYSSSLKLVFSLLFLPKQFDSVAGCVVSCIVPCKKERKKESMNPNPDSSVLHDEIIGMNERTPRGSLPCFALS